jgi:hypothetical protein
MKTEKSLEEVWNWKEKTYQETKDLSIEERVNKIKEEANELSRKYDLNLTKIKSKQKIPA